MNFLFLGDIVGRSGRDIILSELQELKSKISDNEQNYSESLEKVSNSINNFLEKIN